MGQLQGVCVKDHIKAKICIYLSLKGLGEKSKSSMFLWNCNSHHIKKWKLSSKRHPADRRWKHWQRHNRPKAILFFSSINNIAFILLWRQQHVFVLFCHLQHGLCFVLASTKWLLFCSGIIHYECFQCTQPVTLGKWNVINNMAFVLFWHQKQRQPHTRVTSAKAQ